MYLPMLILWLCVAIWSARAEDWPMWGYDAGRSGDSPAELSDTLYLQWSREFAPPRRAWPAQHDDGDKLEFDLSYAPVVMGERLFIASMNSDRLTAYRTDDGAELWRYYADGPMRLAPAGWNGKIYCVSDDGRLYCLDADSGELRWKFDAAPNDRRALGNNRVISMWPARGGPVVRDGIVYFAAGVWPFMGTFVFALDAETGEKIWANTGDAMNWQAQPHGGAFAFAGIAPQGYLAASEDHLVVSGGRAPPGVFDRQTGRLLHMNISVKGPGGYHVITDDTFFDHSGSKWRLSDGRRQTSAPRPGMNEDLLERALALTELDEDDIYTVLAAHGRLFAVTKCGRLYCFGPNATTPIEHQYASVPLAEHSDYIRGRASAIIEESGRRIGYALFLGVGDGALMEELAARSELHIVGLDSDAEKIAVLRKRFEDAGLYGERIALIRVNPANTSYPPYISSIIVIQDPGRIGLNPDAESLSRVFGMLRPYGGKAFLGFEPGEAESARNEFQPEKGQVSVVSGQLVLVRDGPLPGAGQWTHQYADAANTALSHDKLVRLPLGVLWFGSESHTNILPRHAAGPRPQIAGGRLVILGVETISARDVYTGREIWSREFPGIGHPFTNLELEERWSQGTSVYMSNIPGAAYIGSPYATLPDSVYLRHQGGIFRLDPETGNTLAEFPLSPAPNESENDWGHISVWENFLITTVAPHQFDDARLGWLESWNATSSRHLVVMDRFTGNKIWERRARIGYRHNAIAAAEGRLFVIDGLSEQALEFMSRRGEKPEENAAIIAMDIKNGETLWETEEEVFGTYLAYDGEHNILLESGSADTRRVLPDEPHSNVTARNASDGQVIWKGRLQFPAIIHGEMLVPARPGGMLNLLSGERKSVPHPITGADHEWSYSKFYGCSAANASLNLLLFRSGAAGYADIARDGGTGNFGGFKAGCTANLIAADGILNAPDYTRTCTCSYQNQTSLGLIHMPDTEIWTSIRVGRGSGPVKRAGLNLGAPGNRRCENGTLWIPFPRPTAPTPDMKITMDSYGFRDAPVRLISANASFNSREAANPLDGDDSTIWEIRCNGKGRFGQWIQYDLNDVVSLDRVEAEWSGPTGVHFRIETSIDGRQWSAVFDNQPTAPHAPPEPLGKIVSPEDQLRLGNDKAPEPAGKHGIYDFEPTPARHVRLLFGNHSDMSEDRRGRRRRMTLVVSSVRIGGLAWPDAYSYLMPRDIFRYHSLFVDGSGGPNWIAASGIHGAKMLKMENIGAGGRSYTVNLHFMEPDDINAGERVFDVLLQGQKVADELDILQVSGGRRRAWVRSFKGIEIDDSITVELVKSADSVYPPVLSGLEIFEE